MVEGDFPKSDGDVLFASEANLLAPILLIYTGADLNLSSAGSSTATEMTDITFGNTTPDYINIQINANIYASTLSIVSSTSVSIKIEAKEIGGSYSTIFDRSCAAGGRYSSERTNSVNFLHTLTSGMKTNGVKYRLTTTLAEGASSSSVFTNDIISFIGVKSI